jgi:type III pantothenate kinase
MLLVVDVGNSNTVLGLLEGARVAHHWRITTQARTADEFGLLSCQLLAQHGVDLGAVEGAAVCTVVPAVLPDIVRGIERYLHVPAKVLDHRSDLGFPVRLADVRSVGPDRLVNCVALVARVPPPFLVIDFGTATTFDCVDASGAFVGGAIAPGLGIAADALARRTARLPRVDLRAPDRAIGADTVGAIQSGLFWGYVGLVDGLARRCKAELDAGPVRCIATGGLARVVGDACVEIDEVDEHLTLEGLRVWFERGAK